MRGNVTNAAFEITATVNCDVWGHYSYISVSDASGSVMLMKSARFTPDTLRAGNVIRARGTTAPGRKRFAVAALLGAEVVSRGPHRGAPNRWYYATYSVTGLVPGDGYALKFDGRETMMEHDADDLLRLIAPRLLYVGSASKDASAGPEGEFEATRRASELWRAYGHKGISLTAYPDPGTTDIGDFVGFHLRPGEHRLLPYDWKRCMDFADRYLKKSTVR